jgi:hypothetical protein
MSRIYKTIPNKLEQKNEINSNNTIKFNTKNSTKKIEESDKSNQLTTLLDGSFTINETNNGNNENADDSNSWDSLSSSSGTFLETSEPPLGKSQKAYTSVMTSTSSNPINTNTNKSSESDQKTSPKSRKGSISKLKMIKPIIDRDYIYNEQQVPVIHQQIQLKMANSQQINVNNNNPLDTTPPILEQKENIIINVSEQGNALQLAVLNENNQLYKLYERTKPIDIVITNQEKKNLTTNTNNNDLKL